MQNNERRQRPVLAVSMGDPLGIGPEVIVKALNERIQGGHAGEAGFRAHIYGCEWALREAAERAGLSLRWETARLGGNVDANAACVVIEDDLWPDCRGLAAGNHAASGEVSFASVLAAIEACKLDAGDARAAGAICTGPISKKAWQLAGHGRYLGHTELLGEQLGQDDAVMFFLGPRIKLVLATVHIPLSRVASTLSTSGITHAATLGWKACRDLGISSPRVAVCGLNPHAGEDGLLGEEDEAIIAPAVALLRAKGIDAHGPLSADSLFLDAVKPANAGGKTNGGKFDLFVAMYHDQGLIPVKLLDRDASVNITLGLCGRPGTMDRRDIVRTSPAHGTAFNIAGQNKADAASMLSAIDAAVRLMS